MKSLTQKSLIALALSATLVACDSTTEPATTTDGATKESAVEAKVDTAATTEFKNEYDKGAYAIGVNFSNQLSKNFAAVEKYGIEVDKDLILKGIQEGFAGTAQLNEAEVSQAVLEFQTSMSKVMHEKDAADAAAKAVELKAKTEAYIAEFLTKEGVVTTESGLMYRVLESKGGDKKPTADDTVKVHYQGTFVDGEEFDSSYSRNAPATFPLKNVIRGWTEGVTYMAIGDKFEFVIPSELAYGEKDRSGIPGGSTLVFSIELLEINPEANVKAEPEAQ